MSSFSSDRVRSKRFTDISAVILAVLMLVVVLTQLVIAGVVLQTRAAGRAQAVFSPTPTVAETVTAPPPPLSYQNLPPLEGWPCTMANGMPGRLAVKKNPPQNLLSCD